MITHHLQDLWNMFLMLPLIKNASQDPHGAELIHTSGEVLGPKCAQGVKKYQNFAYVLYGLFLMVLAKLLNFKNKCFRPYYSNCLYCHIKYDVIGKLEDSAADILYIAIKQNLTTLLPELTKTNRKTRGHSSSYDRIEHYMSQLEVGLKWRLYELYQPDFELFGYEPI